MFSLPNKIMNKKYVNKVLAVATAVTMMVPMVGMNVFAVEGTTNPTTAKTDVKYVVEGSYKWSIHSEINFGKNAGINQHVAKEGNKVQVTENIIPEGKKLNIKVAGSGDAGAFTITNGGTEVLTYHANNGGAKDIAVNGDVLNVNAGTNTGETTMKFTLDTTTKAAEVAGDYNGTLTYTASIVDQK